MKLRLVAFMFAFVLASGCTSGAPSSDETKSSDPSKAETAEDALEGTCLLPRRYIAVLAEGACAEISGRRGRWVPTPLFEDAPELTGSCVYTWSGERYARVDRAALLGAHEFPTTLTPACGSDPIDDEVVVYEADSLSPGGMAGAVGCDVCGVSRGDGRVLVVLPPERVTFGELKVKLSSGRDRVFQIGAAPSTRRLSIQLPPPPVGTQYASGAVYVQ
jgi:hypothetical protein